MDYFAKKQWIRIAICAVLVAAIVLAMTGVFTGNGSLKYDPSAKKLAAGETEAEATMQGFGGDVTAHVILDGNTVKELTIDTPNETEGLGKRASDAEFTDQFIGKDGPFTFGENGIEALSGATVTSTAALKAINKAVTGEEAAEEPAAEPAVEEKAEETETAAADENAITATEQGFGGDVTVHVTLDGDKIQKLAIDTPNETAGLGQRASDAAFTDQFIGKSGPFTYGEDGIEALTGATITSNAVLKAINNVVPAAEKQEEPAPAEEPAEAIGTAAATDAAVTAAEQGFGGDVTVHVTLDGDKIQALTIDTPNETAGLGQRASEAAFTDQFIGKNGPFTYGEDGIEALTGATITSNAVLKAINSVVPAAEQKEEAAATEEPAAEATAEPAAEATEAPAEKAETKQEAASDGQAYAVYRATKENAFSKVTVTASAKNGTLTDVKITSEGEEGKDLLTDAIREEWAKAILESGSATPDAITGATLKFSAGSVQEAMEEILARMNGETAAAPAEESAAEETKAEEPAVEEPAAEEAAPEKKEEPAAAAAEKVVPAYAAYRAEAENNFSKVTVIAYAKNGKLANVKILSEGEGNNDLLTDAIREEWAKAILESGSAAPDAITGATLKFSTGSVQEAAEKVLAMVAGN